MTEKITAAQYRLFMAGKGRRPPRAHKFGAKSKRIDGHFFPSLLEANRYENLKLLRRRGLIRRLELQPRFSLMSGDELVSTYVADFQFEELQGGVWVVVIEDAKGVEIDVYKLKRKMFRQQYPHLQFREVRRRGKRR